MTHSVRDTPREMMVAQFVLELRQLDAQGQKHWQEHCIRQWKAILTADEFAAACSRYSHEPSEPVRGFVDELHYGATP